MLIEQIKTLGQASARNLRHFGLTVGGLACLLSLWFSFRGKPWWPLFSFPGGALFILGALAPRSLKWAYVVWMALATMLGAIVSTILLTLLFYTIVTPVGLIARLAGKDFLGRQWNPAWHSSYWMPRRSKMKQRESYERQF